MNFSDIEEDFSWIKYSAQQDREVTYIFVAEKPIFRLRGKSDILYIGKTDNSIQTRYRQETQTRNTPGNTQMTNIRLTYAFHQLRLMGVEAICYFTKGHIVSPPLSSRRSEAFSQMVRTWDKRSFNNSNQSDFNSPIIEKYLLVNYAEEHLELPPLNNRF